MLPTWIEAGSMATARAGHTATLLGDGKVLVVGGVGAGSEPNHLATAELFDPADGRWRATGSMATARSGHTATRLPDDTVLVVGGGDEDTSLEGGPRSASAELFDPSSGKWRAIGSMTEARKGFTTTLLADGTVLVAGGGGNYIESELYDPKSGKWSVTGSMAEGRFGHTATLLADGTVLATGGCACSEPGALASAELYDALSGTWIATGSMTQSRIGHRGILLGDGRVLEVGSDGRGGPTTAETYQPADGKWTSTASTVLVGPLTLLPDGRVLVAGGVGDDATARSAELYDLVSGRWIVTASMGNAHAGATATSLSDGRVLVAGGSDNSGTLQDTAELYVPGS